MIFICERWEEVMRNLVEINIRVIKVQYRKEWHITIVMEWFWFFTFWFFMCVKRHRERHSKLSLWWGINTIWRWSPLLEITAEVQEEQPPPNTVEPQIDLMFFVFFSGHFCHVALNLPSFWSISTWNTSVHDNLYYYYYYYIIQRVVAYLLNDGRH